MERYKAWVRQHPGVVQNLDWLLYLPVWNPARLGSSEASYEAYHAAVGLLSLWHQHVIDEPSQEAAGEESKKRARRGLWLDAIEQVETLIELRAIHLEKLGKMSRYSPLLALETAKALLKMAIWVQFPGHLFLRHPSPQDLDQFESEQGVSDIAAALQRLHTRYTRQPSPEQLLQQQQQALLLLAPPPPVAISAPSTIHAAALPALALASVAEHGSDSRTADDSSDRNEDTNDDDSRSLGDTCTAAADVQRNKDPRVLIHRGLYSLFTTLGINSPAGGQGIRISGVTAVNGQHGTLTDADNAQEPENVGAVTACPACSASAGAHARCDCSCTCHHHPQQHGMQQAHDQQECTVRSANATPTTATHHLSSAPTGWSNAAVAWLATISNIGSSSSSDADAAGCGSARLSSVGGGACMHAGADADDDVGERFGCKTLEAARARVALNAAREHHMGINLVWLSQMLFIWRPVLYVALLRRHGRLSWRPWSTSLAVDLLSIHFQGRGRAHLERAATNLLLQQQGLLPVTPQGGQHQPRLPRPSSLLSVALMRGLQQAQLSQGEQFELIERKKRLLWYLLRGPFLDIWVKRMVLGVRNRSKRVPGMAFAADYLYGLLDTFCGYYTYTA